jgi:formimidoylglutamate deiminase
LDEQAPNLLGKTGDKLLDALVFAGNTNAIRDVIVGGRMVVKNGHHAQEQGILGRFKTAVQELLA